MNTKAKISEERRVNAYHDRMDSIRKGGEKVKTVENETTEKVTDVLEKTEETKTLQEIPGFTGNLEALEKSGLEPFDFLVDSSTWEIKKDEDGIEYKESPTRDIWELLGGVKNELIGKQLFTIDSAIRETVKCGKKFPNNEDWEKICEPYGDDGERMAKELGLSFAGFRYRNTGYYSNQSVSAFYWSSSPSTSNAFNLYFSASGIYPTGNGNRADAFSLRCLKN